MSAFGIDNENAKKSSMFVFMEHRRRGGHGEHEHLIIQSTNKS